MPYPDNYNAAYAPDRALTASEIAASQAAALREEILSTAKVMALKASADWCQYMISSNMVPKDLSAMRKHIAECVEEIFTDSIDEMPDADVAAQNAA